MISIILTAVLAVSNAATLGDSYEHPRYARKAFGLFNPFGSSDQRSHVPSGGYGNDAQGVVVDAASPDTRTSGAGVTGLGGSRDSYGSLTSKVGDAAFTAHKTIDSIGSAFGSFFGGGGNKKDMKTGTQLMNKVVEVDDDTTVKPTIDSGINLKNMQFPLYIQDFASELDIQKYYEDFAKGHGISVGQYGVIIKTLGGYLYKGDDGKIYIIKYIVDENEFKEKRSNLPNQFSIPDGILKVIKEITENGEPETSLRFPIFIQDFCSEYDTRTYFYGLAKGSGVSVGQNGVIIKIEGGYLYKGGDGKFYIVKYITDENELKGKGSNLPTQFLIPSEILKVLKKITENEVLGVSNVAKTSIEFPVYVQDFANEYETKLYFYGLAKDSGLSIGQKGIIVKIDGGYLYKGEDGKIYIVKYIIDESEFKRIGGTLEIQFSIPSEILKVLKESTEKEAAGESGIVKTNIQFPIYIQDVADEFYIQKYYEGLAEGSGTPFGQNGFIIKTDDGFLYKGDDGKIYIVKYIVNENEFKGKGSIFENQFSIPSEVLEVLSQINIQFPVYIQDFASDLEIIKYYYGLTIGSGISVDKKGIIIKTDTGYLYKGDDRKIYIVRYFINKNEYKNNGNNLKNKFLIPGEILKVLKELTEKEAAGRSAIAQTNIQFPVYIQNFANKFEEKKYYYGLARGSGISFGDKRVIIKTNEGYLYKGDDGKIYIVKYISDENELMEKGSTLENQFAIPGEPLKVIKEITRKDTASNSAKAQINIKFPVYIQDIASAFDIQKYYEGLAKGSGLSIGQNKIIIKTDDGYLYKGDDGKIYIVKYVVDENKLRETESSLDTQFFIPDDVLEVLVEINIQFPVYIQDIASENDKKLYFYGLATGGGISVGQKRVIIKTNGGYLYKGDDGKIYIVRYIVNENELKEKASNLPTRYSIPAEVLNILKENTERETAGKHGIVQTNIQFPVYVQDLASKYDEKKYYYGLARGSGISIGENRIVIKTNGGYLYKGDDGKIYIVRYIIDETDFREKSSTLENLFSIPKETLKVVREIAEKEAAGGTSEVSTNIEFPVYIQDFANFFDIKTYYEGLANGSGIYTRQNKVIIKTGGGYLYKGDDGNIFFVKYILDENELKEKESTLETQFTIPDDILEELRVHPINVQFPVYIQDFASEYDKKQYFYGVATGNGLTVGQKGVIVKIDSGYLYKDDDGTIYIVKYIVNATELKEKASALRYKFSIPGEILEVIKQNTEKETAGTSGIPQITIQFPVYIQDFASELDIQRYYEGLAKGNGISIGPKVVIIKTNEGYLYKGDDGMIYIIRYIINAEEFKEKSSSLETQFLISDEILGGVKKITAKETDISSRTGQEEQVFASELDTKKYFDSIAKGNYISIGQKGVVVETDGGYLYQGEDGKIYFIKFTTARNDFKYQEGYLQPQYSIPNEILNAVVQITKKEGTVSTTTFYSQELANEFNMKEYFDGLAKGIGISIGQKFVIVRTNRGYLYRGDDGYIYIVKYTTDKNEFKFQPHESHHLSLTEILETLRQIAGKRTVSHENSNKHSTFVSEGEYFGKKRDPPRFDAETGYYY